jgi:hypothetical protein
MSAGYRIEAVHARNLAVKLTRMAAMPEVGTFFGVACDDAYPLSLAAAL